MFELEVMGHDFENILTRTSDLGILLDSAKHVRWFYLTIVSK